MIPESVDMAIEVRQQTRHSSGCSEGQRYERD